MLAGESVLRLVAETGVPEQTLHRWKAQGRVDAGLADGVTLSVYDLVCRCVYDLMCRSVFGES
jgi:hypothetical protein